MARRRHSEPIRVTLPRRSSRLSKIHNMPQNKFVPKASSKNPTNIAHVPTEVLCIIFSYLTTYELFFNVRPVCRRWREVAMTPILWKSIEVAESVPTTVVANWLKHSKLLKSFVARGRNDMNSLIETVKNISS